MRFLVVFSIAIGIVFASPESVGYQLVSHAVADSTNERIQAAVSDLQNDLSPVVSSTNNELCNIEPLKDFFGEPREILIASLHDIPCELLSGLKRVVVFDDPKKPRALAGATSLHLRSDIFTLPEARKIFIHEFAHIVDLSGLRSKTFADASPFKDGNAIIYTDDPSYDFYSISWENNNRWSVGTQKTDFISGYAATDPFEDFSESLLMFVESGNHFRSLAKKYPQLQKKYDFLRDIVFDGQEFATGEFPADYRVRQWDATKTI